MIVMYYANGEDVTNLPAPQTVELDSGTGTYHGTLSSQVPVREGYTFSGWVYAQYRNQTYPLTIYEPGWEFYYASAVTQVSVYAVWNTADEIVNAPSYTIAYNANGGTGAPSAQTKTYAVPLTMSSTAPTRDGKTFINWNTEPDGSGSSFYKGQVVRDNIDRNLYAIWSGQSYTISYNANGGIGAPSSQTKEYNQGLALSDTIPEREGFTFRGWNTEEDGTGITYMPGQMYYINGNLALYAIWEVNVFGNLEPGANLNGRTIYSTVPAGTGITTNKIIAKSSNTNFFCESVTNGVTSGYYQWLKADSTIGQVIFYRNGSSPINMKSFQMPDDFGTLVEVDENAVLYPYLMRQGHEKAFLVTEDMSFVEGVRKKDFDALVERVAALENS